MRAQTTCAIIAFPQERVRKDAAVSAGPAQVVMFTGVRIERMYDLSERLPATRTGSTSRGGDVDFY
ncbi:hypothetical protein [Aestuariivirga sp.]|uniref:hypothetical protein n=1 Tax=Aestuariivirga sp. TaxID=2650926 RepID=UPI003BAC2F59